MRRYFMDYPTPLPVEVECPIKGYPNKDADGRVQYENTHFDTEPECWAKLFSEAEASVSLDCRAVTRARKVLADAEASLVESTLVLQVVKTGKVPR